VEKENSEQNNSINSHNNNVNDKPFNKNSNSSKNNNPIIITSPPPPPPPEKSSHQTTVSSTFTAGNCPSDIVETKSISSLISRNSSFKPLGAAAGADKNNGNNQLENNNAGHSSVLFTPFFERNDSNSETR